MEKSNPSHGTDVGSEFRGDMKTIHNTSWALGERSKELHCLYDISRLFSQRSIGLEALLKEIVKFIPNAWQFPERTSVRISYGGQEYRSRNYSPGSRSLTETIELKKRKCGFIEITSLDEGSHVSRTVFLVEEKKLLKAIADLLGSIIEKKEAGMVLKQTTNELRKQAVELEHKNIALTEVVEQIEIEKSKLKGDISTNISELVFPILEKLRLTEAPSEYLDLLEHHLREITGKFGIKLSKLTPKLSPREIEISSTIQFGLTSKEIARLLNISFQTVEKHRRNIRKKVGISGRKINLVSFLQTDN